MKKIIQPIILGIVSAMLLLAAVPAFAGGSRAITLISPGNGATLNVGQKVHVHWSYAGYPDTAKVNVVLWQNGVKKCDIAQAAPIHPAEYNAGHGGFWWTVGQQDGGQAVAGCGYTVTFLVKNYPGEGSLPSQPFCIAGAGQPAAITVLSPNGGEKWLPGNTHEIRWSATGVSGKVKIRLRKAGWTIERAVANDLAADAGVFAWKVGDLLPPHADMHDPETGLKIAVVTLNGQLGDESDASFSFSQRIIPNLPGPQGGNPWIKISSPKSGDVAQRFAPFFIRWTFAKSLQGKKAKLLLLKADGSLSQEIEAKCPLAINEYRWNVPGKDFLAAGNYKLRMQAVDAPAVKGDSGVFAVAADDGEVVSAPADGFSIKPGEDLMIRWRKDFFATAKVKVELYSADKKNRKGPAIFNNLEQSNSGECQTNVAFKLGFEVGKHFRIKVSASQGGQSAWSGDFMIAPLQKVEVVKTFDSASMMWFEKRAKEDEGAWLYKEMQFDGLRAGMYSRFEDLKRGGYLYQGFAFRTYILPDQAFLGWDIVKAEVKLRVSAQNFIDPGAKAIYLYARDDYGFELASPLTLVGPITDPGDRNQVIRIDVTNIIKESAAGTRNFYGFVLRGWNESFDVRLIMAYFFVYEPRLEVTYNKYE